jgi:hypothetical protein
MNYIYTMEDSDLACANISDQELRALDLGDFQHASDLPDEVVYADGVDSKGQPVRVYRQPASLQAN